VIIASGKLRSRPKVTPISQPGHEGSWMSGITSPIAKRLKNAPSKAVFLSGNDIGSIKPTSIAPKIRPLTRPDKRGDMAEGLKIRRRSVKRIQIRTLPAASMESSLKVKHCRIARFVWSKMHARQHLICCMSSKINWSRCRIQGQPVVWCRLGYFLTQYAH